MEKIVKIPAIVRDNVTPEGMTLVEIGYHRVDDNGHCCPFPFKIDCEYWPPHEIASFENFVANEYNSCKLYEQEKNQTLHESANV